MLLLDDAVLPPSDTPPDPGLGSDQFPPLGEYGFHIIAPDPLGGGNFWVTVLLAVVIAVSLAAIVAVTARFMWRRKNLGLVFGGILLGAVMAATGTLILGNALIPTIATTDQSEAFSFWAAETYDVEVSRAGYLALASGSNAAVSALGSRAEVHLISAQDGLFYLFDSNGNELPLVGAPPVSGEPDFQLPADGGVSR